MIVSAVGKNVYCGRWFGETKTHNQFSDRLLYNDSDKLDKHDELQVLRYRKIFAKVLLGTLRLSSM